MLARVQRDASITTDSVRFGRLEVPEQKIIRFPQGLPGLSGLVRWCMLGDPARPGIDWLQSLDDPHVALMTADPDRFFDDYDIGLDVASLEVLGVADPKITGGLPPVTMRVVLRVDDDAGETYANLKAPILINLENRLAMQFVLHGAKFSIRHPLSKRVIGGAEGGRSQR